MIRPVTCLAFLLACGSGLYLYQSKHRVKVLDDEIAATARSTGALREQTRMLSAEWTLLNDPERLRQLATQFLALQTVAPTQFTSLADLDSRLPPPLPQGAPPAPEVQVPIASAAPGAGADHAADQPGPAAVVADAKLAAAGREAAPAQVKDAAAKDAAIKEAARDAVARDAVVRDAVARDGAIKDATRDAATRRVALARPPESVRTADPHPSAPHIAAIAPRPFDPRAIERRSPEVHDVAQRSFVPRAVERRPVMAGTMGPPMGAPGGSLLGMAHDMAAPPMPRPLPMPQPITYGGTGG